MRKLSKESERAARLSALGRVALERTIEPNRAIATYLVMVCDQLDWSAAIFYLVDPASPRQFTPTHHVHLKSERRTMALELIAKRAPGDDLQGLGGRVLDLGKPAWIEDVALHPQFKAADLAELLGLRGAIAVPIYIGGRLGAMAEFFSAGPLRPQHDLLTALDAIGRVLGDRLSIVGPAELPP